MANFTKALAGVIFIAGLSASAQAAVLTHEWTLNGSTADTFGGPSIVLPNPSGLGGTGYTFGEDQGPSISGAIDPSAYSIEMAFTLNTVDGYRKLIDFKDRTTDLGLYDHDGTTLFHHFTPFSAPVLAAGQPIHLVATRDASDLFTLYINGSSVLSFLDDEAAGVFTGPNNIVWLLQDDYIQENPSGFLDYVRFYDGALNAGEVTALEVPSPGALSLLGFGLLGAGFIKRRR